MPPELLGPLGLTAAALLAIAVLWRSHERADQDMRADRDMWREMALRGTQLAEKATDAVLRRP